MANLVCTISKYLVLLFMALYTIKCFTYFTARDREKRTSNLNKQIFYIFMIHFLCHVMLYINMEDAKVFLYYIIEISIAILYILAFRLVYKNSSRLLTNNVAFLMLIGYTVLLRLSPGLAIRQFILASVGLVVTIFIPFIMGKLKKLRMWSTLYGLTGIILLASVFIPGVGQVINGSRNWIHIAGVSLQPMEFVKILFIFFVASSLVKLNTFVELFKNAIIAATFMLILVVGLSVAIRMSQRLHKLQEAKKDAERIRTDAELKNLRNQLNPHFLLNTLNNIYALIAFDPEKAQTAVGELSKHLRHALYDNQKRFVPLYKEVEFIKNYIELMKIRVTNNVKIDTSINIDNDDSTPIAPLIFISLIENAFKHGISQAGDGEISIAMSNDGDKIICEIINTNHPKHDNDKSGSGIGLEQVAKRLELMYPGRYDWQKGIDSDTNKYFSKIILYNDNKVRNN